MTDLKIAEGNLSEVRMEMQYALTNFHEHIKYTITLMTTAIALAIGLFAFAIDHSKPEQLTVLPRLSTLMFICGFVFLAVVPAARWSEKICRRYYLIYAANDIFYARCHLAQNDYICHPWVHDLFRTQNMTKDDINSDDAVDRFINADNSKDPNSWFYYRRVLIAYLFVGAIGALYFFYRGFQASP